MKKKQGVWIKCMMTIVLLLFFWGSNIGSVYAGEAGEGLPRLIQTMSEQEEYEGLLHLGMLTADVTAAEDVEAAYQNVRASAVKLSVGNLRGSGSVFEMQDDRLLLVTCGHLFENAADSDMVEVTFADMTQAVGTLCYRSGEYDVAFVEISVMEVPVRTLKNLRQIGADSKRAETVIAGTEMFHVGMLGQEGSVLQRGVVDNPWKYFPEFQSFMIDSFCEGRPGMSGGGTFDAYGNYIGMIAGGLLEKTASIPLSLIREEYNKIDF